MEAPQMYETVPMWGVLMYYFIFISTLVSAVWTIIRGKLKALAGMTIIVSISVLVIQIFNSIGRRDGMNELDHLFSRFEMGDTWAIFVIIGYIYIVIWWTIFLLNRRTKGNV